MTNTGQPICTGCQINDHRDHQPDRAGVCPGCACEWSPVTHPTSDDPMLRIDNRLAQCAHCDAGLPANCTCPGADEYREDVPYLLGVIQSLVERDIAKTEAVA